MPPSTDWVLLAARAARENGLTGRSAWLRGGEEGTDGVENARETTEQPSAWDAQILAKRKKNKTEEKTSRESNRARVAGPSGRAHQFICGPR